MPFAYIDSQGKEVSIPSADALRLRIELGAIVDTTELHDVSTGQRGPAAEHEIYQTLKRELDDQEVDGFVTPPPPRSDSSDELPSEAWLSGIDRPADEPSEDDPTEVDLPEDDRTGVDPTDQDPTEDDPFDMGMGGLTLSPEPDLPEELEVQIEPPPRPGQMSDATTRHEPWAEDDVVELGGAADPPTTEQSDDPFVMDDGAFGAGPRPSPTDEEPHRWDVSAEVEGVVPVGGAAESGDDYGAWQDPTTDPGDAANVAERPADPYDRSGRSSPRAAPSQRKLTPKGSAGGAGRVIGIALGAVILAGAGWFALQAFGGSDGAETTTADESLSLPALPIELQPQLRQLAQRASVRMVERFDSMPQRAALPEGPGDLWLAGDYLANASEYDATAIYWRRMGEMVAAMRSNETAFFEEAYRDEVASANLTEDNADLLVARGLAGFAAAAPDRAIIYDQLEGVVKASTDLHIFLMQNEADIDFEPADGGTSRDPLLEAVPVTRSLGEEMMGQVIEITDALDSLGFLEVVASEPLLSVVEEKLIATGIR